uniref:HMG box domain-containing protein n=1 Tax=Timema bartmani TaxID=61472 RepID=A0A7R9F111_9NEOP|nr:unnamed protein product [Timema bartmani]
MLFLLQSSRRPKTSSTPFLLAEAGECKIGKTTLSTPDQDSNLNLTVTSSLVYCENESLDHVSTEAEHTKIIAQQWQKLEPSAKQKFEEEFKKEMIHYLAVCVSYENSLTNQQKEDLQKAKEEIVESKQQKQLKMKKKELGKPKKPLSAFLIFFQEKIKLKGDTPFKIWQQKLSQEWESLPDEKKAQYLDKASHHWQLYRQELQLWEEKMIRLGHIDVVRNEALIEPRSNK